MRIHLAESLTQVDLLCPSLNAEGMSQPGEENWSLFCGVLEGVEGERLGVREAVSAAFICFVRVLAPLVVCTVL